MAPAPVIAPIVAITFTPQLLSVTLIRLVVRVGDYLLALPLAFARPLAGCLAAIVLFLEPRICRQYAPATRTGE
jgi:hypothetical protein